MNLYPVRPFLFLLVLCAPVLAQTKTDPEQLKLVRQRAQAVAMIEETAADAPLWDDQKSAVEVLAVAADLLWSESPSRSAKWLTRAWELIETVGETGQDDGLREFVRTSPKSSLQSTVLRVAHTHDPKLADKFIEQLTQSQPEERKDRGAFDDRSARSEQFLWLAQQLVNTNPQLAFDLAQRSLVDGVSFTLQNVLTSLRKKDASLANRLFDLALARLTSRVADPSEAEVLAGYLFQPGITFSSSSDGRVIMTMNPFQRNEPPVAQSEPQRAREFLVAAYQAFLTRPVSLDTPSSRSRAQQIWVFGTRNLKRYETAAPEFVVPATAYLAQLEQRLFPSGRANPFPGSATEGQATATSVEDAYERRIRALEERAEKSTDPAAKRLAYVEASLAVEAADYPRAKEIAEKIDDEDVRAQAVRFAFYRAALSFVGKKDLDNALKLIGKIDDAHWRSVVRIAVAYSLLKERTDAQAPSREDMKIAEVRALELLNEVEKDLRKENPSANGARLMLGRATLTSMVDMQQTLFALQQALQIINKLDRFDLKDPMPPRLGISISPRSRSLADGPRVGFSFRTAIDAVVTEEFEELAQLAGSFRIKEVRGIARVEVARLFLEKTASRVAPPR